MRLAKHIIATVAISLAMGCGAYSTDAGTSDIPPELLGSWCFDTGHTYKKGNCRNKIVITETTFDSCGVERVYLDSGNQWVLETKCETATIYLYPDKRHIAIHRD